MPLSTNKPLTKSQVKLLDRANKRAAALMSNDWSATVPAAVFLQTETLNNRFSKSTLDAAKRFLRMSTSTIKGARKYARAQGFELPPKRPQALTEKQRRDIKTANQRLQALRARGEYIREPYNIGKFSKATAQLAAEFLQQPWTTKRKKRAPILRQFPSDLGRAVMKLIDAMQWSRVKDAYYDARANDNIPEDMTLEEFADQAYDKRTQVQPGITGRELLAWVRQGGDIDPPPDSEYLVTVSRRAYDNLLKMAGGKERKFLEYMEDFYTGNIEDLPLDFRRRMGLL